MSKASTAIRLATQRPGRFPHASLGVLVWIALVWVLLWGEVTTANIVSGFLLALLLTTVAPFPMAPFDGRFRPRALALLIFVFLTDLLKASWQQAKFVVSTRRPRGAIIRVRLRSTSDSYLTMTAGMSALIPGTVVVDVEQSSGTLYVHIFDVALAGGLDAAHASILAQEERILRAFASRADLVAAGFVPDWSTRAGRLPVPCICTEVAS